MYRKRRKQRIQHEEDVGPTVVLIVIVGTLAFLCELVRTW